MELRVDFAPNDFRRYLHEFFLAHTPFLHVEVILGEALKKIFIQDSLENAKLCRSVLDPLSL